MSFSVSRFLSDHWKNPRFKECYYRPACLLCFAVAAFDVLRLRMEASE